MTLTLYLIPDMEKFLELVQDCCGEVILHLPDKTMCNLKGNIVAQQILKLTKLKQNGLKVSFSDFNDIPDFVRYMMEAVRN